MSFSEIAGQPGAVQTLERALATRRVHHAYRFEGPQGVGKEKTAFALARALVCEKDGVSGCEQCGACKRATTFSAEEPRVPLHPDVVLVQRALYSASLIGAAEATGISVEQIRKVVLARAGFAPHEGRALVFIVREAEELTPQAANALLKTLEEPPARTHFILLTSRPNRLLDTIRSRTQALRFGPLPEAVMARIAEQHGLDPKLVALAEGSAARLFELADPDAMQAKAEFTEAMRKAVAAEDLASGLMLSDARAAEREGVRAQLIHFAQTLAQESRAQIGARPERATNLARQHAVVLGALNELERNVQPALVLDAMLYRLQNC